MNTVFFGIEKIYSLFLTLFAIIFCSVQTIYAQPAGFSDELVIDGWSQAVGLTFDENGRMYVWEKGGKVWAVENGVKAYEPIIDISEEVGNWRDFGLIGFALDPNFLNNGYIYLWYVVDRHHLLYFGTSYYDASFSREKEATIARLTRYTANSSNNFRTIDYDSRKILIGESKSSGPPILHESHGAGQIIFGTDGTLMVSMGDGASYTNPVDEGSHAATYFQQALDDGIITPAQNIGAYRCQTLDNLSGKILRIDPNTGDGIPSNPYFQPSNPRSPQSRIWSMGIRNPYRIAAKPESGSHNASDGNPGTFFFGDVGWSTWEDLNIIDGPGQNFGWPIYEGINQKAGYNNPNYALTEKEHIKPKIDWRHGADQARAFVNNSMIPIGNGGISGKQFRGNSSTGGVWYNKTDFPIEFQNSYFHADYSAGWIRNFGFDEQNNPIFVKDFKLNAGAVVFLNISPIENGLYYVRYPNQIRRIIYTGNSNKKPIAVLDADKTYGASPLRVNFDASQSFDPEYSALSYFWDFGDNATSTEVNPIVVFEAPSSIPATYPISLSVTDGHGATTQKTIPISLNNTPPIIVSTSIDNTNYFNARNGTALNLNAVVTDTEHNGQLKFEWQTALFHNSHSHAEPVDNNPSTATSLSPIECDGSTYWFRITLKVTDPEGLFTTFQKDIFPDCAGLPQSIDFVPISNQPTTSGEIVLNATATSGLPVSNFLLEGPAVIFGNKIVPSGFPGKVTIRMTQGGNEVYQPAFPIESSFNIILPNNATCEAEGLITRDIWIGSSSNSVNDIPINTTPSQTYTINNFEATPYFSAKNAQRIRGLICPPQTGLYTFWIASETESQLWLSTNTNPRNKRLIAYIKETTRANQWNKYTSQQSKPILLVAGNQYFIEALMDSGGHLSAGWKMPDNSLNRPISGKYLSTIKSKQNQIITFFGISDKLTTDPAFNIGASASSGLNIDFSAVAGPATISGTTITLTGPPGRVFIRASQAGNSQYNAAEAVIQSFSVSDFTTEQLSQTISFPPIPDKYPFDESFEVEVNASSGLPVTLSIESGPASVEGKIITLVGRSGTVIIRARQAGNEQYKRAISFGRSFKVTEIIRQDQLISFLSLNNKLATATPFTINASSSSGLPINFSILSGPASINNNVIILAGTEGKVVVRASQNGNDDYLPAPYVDRPFTISARIIEPPINNDNPTSYCQLKSEFPWQEWISKVIFNEINNSTFKDSYKFYEEPTTALEKEKNYSLTIIPAFSWEQWDEYIKAWIDFNQNGSFEDEETILMAINQKGVAYAPVVGVSERVAIPSTALLGKTRMRIAMQRAGYPVDCGVINKGEVEDYIITIVESIPTNDQEEKHSQSIRFPEIPNQLTSGTPILLTATASSNLPIIYRILSGPAIINGDILSLNRTTGTVVVSATQSGNDEYFAAQSINRAFKVMSPDDNGEDDTNLPPTDYCNSKGRSPWQEWIGNVSFGTINNNSFKEGYGDFTNISTLVNKEYTYEIKVSPSFSWMQWDEYINAWIDFNQNGSFEDLGEQILSGISLAGSTQSLPQVVSGTVTIPTNAKTGKTRMRVNMQQAQYADICDKFEYGEVEDYLINIGSSASDRSVHILTFSAYIAENQEVALEWISNGDMLTNNYQIERSNDNLKFHKIEAVSSKGENTLPNFYYSVDKISLKGTYYYRIKQFNKDGSFNYSNTVEIQRDFGTEEFYLYPNPVKDIIHIHLKPFMGIAATINIYNSYGQLVKESKLDNIQIPIISFSIEEMQNGIYYLHIKPEGKKGIGKKFILTRNY